MGRAVFHRKPKSRPRFATTLAILWVAFLITLAPPLRGAARTSANYALSIETIDSGGGQSSSASYGLDSSAGGIGGTASGGVEMVSAGYISQLEARVMGRWVFYNQSAWDGNSAAANASDDAARATNKTALVLGGVATFANYSSYSFGLNGIMVDIADLVNLPTLADFIFKVGNNNTPSGWAAAPGPTTIAVRRGAGVGGSDRVTLIWPNNAIQKQWLEAKVLATGNTGLGAADVFFFGNAIGESGNTTANAQVDVSDEGGARANPRNFLNPAPLDYAYDYNRDKKVDVSDENLARVHKSNFLTALKLIDLTGVSVSAVVVTPVMLKDEAFVVTGATSGADHRAVGSWLEGSDDLGAGPNGGALRFSLWRLGDGRLLLELQGASLAGIQLQSTADLGSGGWQELALPLAKKISENHWQWVLPLAPSQAQQFYRIVQTNP